MFNKIFTILKIKKLRNEKVDGLFLINFKGKLKSYIAENPVIESEVNRLNKELNKFIYFCKLTLKKHMPAVIIALIMLVSGGGVAAASQASLPGDTFYPVKILTEEAKETFTFNEGAKAKLHAQYAVKRVDEIKKMLDKKGVDAKGLKIALANLKEHADESANIINNERGQGKNVDVLAKEVQGKIEDAKNELENNLNQAGEKTSNNEEKKLLKDETKKAKEGIEANEDKIGKSEEFKKEAENAIAEAKKQYEIILAELNAGGIATTSETFVRYNDFMTKAEEAINKEHWVQARQHAEQAVKALEDVKKKTEKSEEKTEKETIKEEKQNNKNENASSSQANASTTKENSGDKKENNNNDKE